MGRFAQVGIAIGALGIIIALMGLFPGMTGVEPTFGIGVVQVIMLIVGYGLLIFGAIIYVKFTFYLGIQSTLMQQVGIRLAMTGLLFAALSGLSDILGFGSHLRTETTDIFFGFWQAFGLLASFAMSSFGVVLYTITGTPHLTDESQRNDLSDIPVDVPDAPDMPDDESDHAADEAAEPAANNLPDTTTTDDRAAPLVV